MFPLGWAGMNIAAYFYNRSLLNRGGKIDVVANIKNVPAHLVKGIVHDCERGLTSEIMPYAWQSETCLGNWHYDRALYDQPGEFGGYLHPRDVIHWLIDTVSKNGTFVLNVPGRPDGTIDSKEIAVLDKITAWMSVNSAAIYETRPWKIFGEGPTKVSAGAFNGTSVANLGAKGRAIHADQGQPCDLCHPTWTSRPGNNDSSTRAFEQELSRRIGKVEVLGAQQAPEWKQTQSGLTVKLPKALRGLPEYGVTVKVYLA